MKPQKKDRKRLRERIEFERGMIEALRHIGHLCKAGIRAHKEEIKRLRKEHKKEVVQ